MLLKKDDNSVIYRVPLLTKDAERSELKEINTRSCLLVGRPVCQMKEGNNEIKRKHGVDDRKQTVAKQDVHWPQTSGVGGEEGNAVLTYNLQ